MPSSDVGSRVLITGGAGFVGSHLADELLRAGYRVRALDALVPQVHGEGLVRPDYLDPDVELLVGDVRDADVVRKALRDVDAVYHFAAMVGVGQSMYEVAHYTDVNNRGTAVLLQAMIENPSLRPRRLVVASSMSLYGEGLYRKPDGTLVSDASRGLDQLRVRDWDARACDGDPLTPIPTPETKPPSLSSVYALSKFDQERLCLLAGRAYDIQTVALRFFNIYGPRQALSNPYTGVLAIFASRLLNGNRPLINEDGEQRRDFVSVYDVARACRLALEVPEAAGQVFNVGSGRNYSVREIAARVAEALGKTDALPEISGKYRVGDIRHCFADITMARQVLGYEPQVDLEEGLRSLASWADGKQAHDRLAEAGAELAARGLTV